MATDRAGTLIDLLREHHLLEPAQLEELTRTADAQNTDPQVLGQCLIELGWLTPFQVDRLVHKRPQDLILGSYHLLERLGQGENGPVFQARKPGKAGTVALKIIPKPRLADPQLLARFQQEVRLAAQLQHPHVAPVAAVGQQGNLFLFAREFVVGADLGRMVRELGPLPVTLACNAVRQAAQALQCAHDKGLSHRRVKPSNLIVADQPGAEATVKLVDFGLGQLKPGATAGLDRAGDLEALGQTLTYLLTGQTSLPASDGLPPEVREIVQRLTPGARSPFHSAQEVAQALEPLSHEPPPSEPVGVNGLGAEPADLPYATAAVEALPVSASFEAVPQMEPSVMPVAVAEPVPLEGIAVPVMGMVGLATEIVPVSDFATPPAEPPPVLAEVAAPEIVTEAPPIAQATLAEPEAPLPEQAALAVGVVEDAAPPEPIPSISEVAPNAPLIEVLGGGIAGEKPGEDDWPPVKKTEPAPAVVEPMPFSATDQPASPPMEPFSASPLTNNPEVVSAVSEPVPGGYFMDQPQATGAIAEDSGYPMDAAVETTARRAPARKKWSKSSILWIIVGLLLHVIAAVILVIAIIALMNRENPPTKKSRPAVPGKQKSKSGAMRKPTVGRPWA